ncbi:MAG: exo-alpha-sialidase, partial [Acidobacteria bacterium]|nr:exo-alpha-sialidase [Acidobacteriota bacterium]
MRLACLLFGPVLFAAEVTRIWDAAPHNAFTDLTYFKGRFICAFREARRHVSTDGKLRVLASKDGKKWQSLALLEDPKADLRDPKLTVTPKGELMLTSAAAYRERDNQSPVPHDSIAYFSKDGVQWSAPVKIGDPNFWLWRANWHKDKAYMIGYETMSRNGVTRLYQSNDGRTFQTVVPALHTENYTNESSIQFL